MLQIYPILCRQGYMNNYSYIIIDQTTKITAVIDPSEATPVIDKLNSLNVKPQFILNTHHHFDHVEGNLEISAKYNAQIACNQADMHRIKGASLALIPDTFFTLGESKAKIIDVSAHTQGHILFYFLEDKALFTGDTLFNLCIGGLFEGTAEQMFTALQKIKNLPDDVLFYPGHEYTMAGAEFALHHNQNNNDILQYLTKAQTRIAQGLPCSPMTLGEEKKCNPYLQASTIEEFKHL